jgi:hypothetical protein
MFSTARPRSRLHFSPHTGNKYTDPLSAWPTTRLLYEILPSPACSRGGCLGAISTSPSPTVGHYQRNVPGASRSSRRSGRPSPRLRLPVLARIATSLLPRILPILRPPRAFLGPFFSTLLPPSLSQRWRWRRRRGRSIQHAALGRPARIRLRREHLELLLPRDVARLLVQRRRVAPRVSQPLVPLRRHLDVAVEGERAVLHDAPHALLLRGERVAELPEGVAVQVPAWEGGQRGGKGVEREWVGGGEDAPTRNLFRHGRWSAFHLYQAWRRCDVVLEGIVQE